MNAKFKNAVMGIPQDVPPIWFMRQAGRYHSHYQNLRKKHTFEELCKNPELSAEVACGPMLDFDYDVAILFSDILFPLELFGLDLSYRPGPTFGNFLVRGDEKKHISNQQIIDFLSFQVDALRLTRNYLHENKSLVGFVGGPWTILSYGMDIKQRDSFHFSNDKVFIEQILYEKIVPIIRKNIELQLNSGAEIVYIFDTNSKQLNEKYYLNTYLETLKNELFFTFKKKLAYFSKNRSFYTQEVSKISDLQLAGVVYSIENGLSEFLRSRGNFFVQGNFSPQSILKPHDYYIDDFKLFVNKIKKLSVKQRSGWICSLNHGVLPKTPEKNVRHFITNIREELSSNG